jgi:hypothetical protein
MPDELAATALELRDGLPAALQYELCLPFDEVERRNWFYWPDTRRGLSLGALDAEQRQLVHRVLTAMVGTVTLAKVMTIVGLEVVLADLEQQGLSSRRRQRGLPRDPSAYFTTLFGDPGGDAPWGVRFEGHHVSLHATVVGGALAPTPSFLGTNPAEVRHDGRVVLRPLAEEEDLARALLEALPAAARRRAIVDTVAPDDILTANSPRIEVDLQGGVPLADLSGEAAEVADALIGLHTDRTRGGAAGPDRGDVHFAWAGDVERGRKHYYRLHGPRFVVEYDNTQNDGNHAHSVWRDPEGDFGEDMLRGHVATQH